MVNVLIATIPDVEHRSEHQRVIDQLQFWPHSKTTDFASAVGYLMIEQLLAKQQVSATAINSLHQNQYGKWMLDKSEVDFNISHSGNKVVAIITDNGKAGVDIEQTRPIAWQEYTDVFSPSEWNLMNHSPDPEILFFHLWTKKESLCKAYGLGMQLDFNKVLINENQGSVMHSCMAGYFYPLMIPGYIAHVCLTHKQGVFVKEFEVA